MTRVRIPTRSAKGADYSPVITMLPLITFQRELLADPLTVHLHFAVHEASDEYKGKNDL